MPSSTAALITSSVCASSRRMPKLLQPTPTIETSREPILRFSRRTSLHRRRGFVELDARRLFVRTLAQELDPLLLEMRIVLGCLADIDALYSGDAIMKPSTELSTSCRACAPAGSPLEISSSRSYAGHSNCNIVARSTVAPFCWATLAASDASLSFIEPSRKEAPNTRSRTEHRLSSAIGFPHCVLPRST